MVRSIYLMTLALWLTLASATTARAADDFAGNAERSPSVFSYARRGFWTGALIGVGGAYLAARPDGIQGEDFRPLVLGTGIGALSGSAIGITLGFLDLSNDQPGQGAIALRDMLYGTGFGWLAGFTVGGLVAVRSHDAEHVLLGGAIGSLSGAGVGLMIGLIEGRRIVDSPRHRGRPVRTATITLSCASDSGGGRVWMPTLNGSF